MSERPHRISRRKLLQITGLAPLTALAASGASSAEIAAAARAFTNSSDPSAPVLDKAQKHDPKLPEELFKQVVWVLWLNFVAGTKEDAAGIENEDAIISRAYIMQTNDAIPMNSGDKIVDNLDKWKDKKDPTGKGRRTNWCAYRVGRLAAERANGKPISEQNFVDAWNEVAIDVKKSFARLQDVKKKGGDDSPIEDAGIGC